MSLGIHSGKPGHFISGLRKHLKRDPYRLSQKRDYFREGQRTTLKEKRKIRIRKVKS